jgi:bifunctional non-homologous end joining protein LigD
MDEDDEDGGAGITLSVSSAEKVLFPDAKITKGALIDYYAEVASAMLPHLRDRPLTLHRFPRGDRAPRLLSKEDR